MKPVNVSFASKEEEHKWIKHEAVDPSGKIRPQDYLAAFWIYSKDVKEYPVKKEGVEVIMYLVGGGYITGEFLKSVDQSKHDLRRRLISVMSVRPPARSESSIRYIPHDPHSHPRRKLS
jgi:hypothetical protein